MVVAHYSLHQPPTRMLSLHTRRHDERLPVRAAPASRAAGAWPHVSKHALTTDIFPRRSISGLM